MPSYEPYTLRMKALEKLAKEQEAQENEKRGGEIEQFNIPPEETQLQSTMQMPMQSQMSQMPMQQPMAREVQSVPPPEDVLEQFKQSNEMQDLLQKYKHKKPARRLYPNEIIKINQGRVIPKTLDIIDKAITDHEDLFGPIEGRLRKMNPYDEETQIFDAQMRAASQQFGRYMEGGVLRHEDELKYKKMFPNVSDMPSVARGKLTIVRQMMKRKQKQIIEALKEQGYDTTGLDLEQREISGAKTIQIPKEDTEAIKEAQADGYEVEVY